MQIPEHPTNFLKKTSLGFGNHLVALPTGSLTGNVGIAIVGLFSGCLVGFSNGM